MSLHASGIKIQHSHIHCYQYYMPPAFARNIALLPIFHASGICYQYCALLPWVPGWRYECHYMPPALKFNIRISIATNIICLRHLLAILRCYRYFMPLAFVTNIASLPILHASGICYRYYVATNISCLWHLLLICVATIFYASGVCYQYCVATDILCLRRLLPILRRYRYFMPLAFITNIASLRDLALLPANAGGM
jgi:hypothetical protein